MAEKKRYVIDPGPQMIMGLGYTLGMYANHYIKNHKALNTNGIGIRAAIRIEAALETPAPYYELRNEDWAMLKEIDADPGDCGYPRLIWANQKTGEKVADEPLPKRIHGLFMDAIADAGTAPPKAENSEAPAATEEKAEEAAE